MHYSAQHCVFAVLQEHSKKFFQASGEKQPDSDFIHSCFVDSAIKFE